jgi:hypothetical protein
MSVITDFELSRVYGRGWNAGKKAISETSIDIAKIEIDKINPYQTPEARERWASGFSEALSNPPHSPVRMRKASVQAAEPERIIASSRHRFRPGQLVTLSATIFERTSPETFKISRLLPIEHGVAQSDKEPARRP